MIQKKTEKKEFSVGRVTELLLSRPCNSIVGSADTTILECLVLSFFGFVRPSQHSTTFPNAAFRVAVTELTRLPVSNQTQARNACRTIAWVAGAETGRKEGNVSQARRARGMRREPMLPRYCSLHYRPCLRNVKLSKLSNQNIADLTGQHLNNVCFSPACQNSEWRDIQLSPLPCMLPKLGKNHFLKLIFQSYIKTFLI